MPQRLMKLLFDPSHLEMPFNVVVAVLGTLASLTVAAWQFIGSSLAQFPTPTQVSGWSERDIYLCALIIAAATIAWMARWVAAKFLEKLHENTESNTAVANALNAFTAKVDTLVVPAVTHAMHETFSKPSAPALGSSRKRYDPPSA